MAIPTTAVLDAFTRADNVSLGANYTTVWGGSSPQIVSNTVKVSAASAFNAVRWNVASFGPDCEVYADLTTFPSTATLGLYLRSDNASNTYECDVTTTGVTFKKTVATVQSTINSASQTFAGGDAVLFSAVANTLSVYRRTGGAWNQNSILTVTDTSITAAGSIAFFVFDTAASPTLAIDNFGGGTFVAPLPDLAMAPYRAP